jgi:outer membrane receptor protein involved in Fe transport
MSSLRNTSQGGRNLPVLALALVVVLSCGTSGFAEGTQTGVLTGAVTSSDGQPLPGVRVSVRSAALQRERSATTDGTGRHIFPGLPPGTYRVSFALAGFTTVERTQALALGGTEVVDTVLTVAIRRETVTVTAKTPSVLTTTQAGANYRSEDIDKLAMGRGVAAIAELAPGVTNNAPNPERGQVTISGAFAYDNVFLLNGVDINDNLFGSPNTLFIEDAIEETQILTSGISAEYGRFSGGVVNAVTKRGGNTISGSFRTNFTNPSWTRETPFEMRRDVARLDKTSRDYSATLGGPIVEDRLWFFVAGRKADISVDKTFPDTGIQYINVDNNRRYETKLTGTVGPNHTLSATYLHNGTTQTRPAFDTSIDPRVIITRTLPNRLFVASYNGLLTSRLFAEAQFSGMKFGARNSGGTSTAIEDSPFLARGRAGISQGRHYNAPFFDATDPDDRNNRQLTGSLSYFLSTSNMGRHDIKGGLERFTTTRISGNSQSATGFVFVVDPVVSGGVPVMDSRGRIIPDFVPGASQIENWMPVRGATIDINTTSFYVNDRWTLNDHWTFNLGARYERIDSQATAVQEGADTRSLVPRLGALFDVMGNGKHRLYATYSRYAGKASPTQFGDNSNAGTPDVIFGRYVGPPGQGMDFAPGFNPANYITTGGSFPAETVLFDRNLGTPTTEEWTLQYGLHLGRRGEVKLVYTNRRTTNFLEDFYEISNGTTTVIRNGRTVGTFHNAVIRNTSDPRRGYQGIQLQSSYPITDHWVLAGHYTHQLRNHGTFEGEPPNNPGSYSIIGNYPGIHVLARNNPDGRLRGYQRHKVRVWTTYTFGLGRSGDLDLGLLYRYNSALTYSLAAMGEPISAIQRARDPGYAMLPPSQVVFFGERGSASFEDSHLFDLSLSYGVPVFKTLRPWLKAELRNAFNAQPLIGFNTSITVVTDGPQDADGIPTTFTRGASFGTGTQNTHYPVARTFQFSVGFRF